MRSVLLILVFFLFSASPGFSDDREDAETAAGLVVRMFDEKKFSELWDSLTHSLFKKNLTRDQFLANMTIGRSTFGRMTSSRHISTDFSKSDPIYNYEGQIYAITFLNEYGPLRFYERIVMALDEDGEFRLAGVFGAPAGSPAQ
ncbi:DUF4019 domain-containing protein [Aurantimonas sp. E1-2-R+4]|uniref:DUF4019 domain-containing protein n=1 Tax=Aurantimonas sp. E1-2-R+4 TaxID=3113714 RepID=UPI002F91F9E6